MLKALLIAVHVIVSFVLILVVLLQTGKRADLAGAFGGGGSQTAFGPRGTASVLSKATTISAVLFMVTSLTLSVWTSKEASNRGTVLDEVSTTEDQGAPAVPGIPAGQDSTGLPAPAETPAEDPATAPAETDDGTGDSETTD
ncbi:MAG: preprotein translocase subunit SecG [Acidobacteriota bacterium]|nr:preprotein translocase subunit SecG [Acidobacteriota bacterium]